MVGWCGGSGRRTFVGHGNVYDARFVGEEDGGQMWWWAAVVVARRRRVCEAYDACPASEADERRGSGFDV